MSPLGEFELIEEFMQRLPATGAGVVLASGDDAAITDFEGPAVISVDSLVEGVHFTCPAFPMRAIGRKALSAALSDLAAMGAEPLHALVAVGVSEDRDDDSMLELADGLGEVARRERLTVLGGDITRAPSLLVSVTVIGREPSTTSRLVTRNGARPGDLVVVTGELGGAGAALEILRSPSRPDQAPQRLLDRQLDPRPRLDEGKALAEAGASAMIDISDGLLADAGHLARRSGVTLEIDPDKVPVDSGIAETAIGVEAARRLAVAGGEDYELLACIEAARLEAAREGAESGLTVIGEVVADRGAPIIDAGSGEALETEGFDHLSSG